MSDQATLSSFEDSISQINANTTATTTPPMGEFSKQSNSTNNVNPKSILSNTVNIDDFDSLPGVLSSLNLDENSMFSSKFKNVGNPSTPPPDWKSMNSWSNNNTSTFGGFSTISELQSIPSANTINNNNNNNNNGNTNHQHSSSASSSSVSKDETVDNQSTPFNTSMLLQSSQLGSSNNYANNNNSRNSSFILPDNQLDSYLFEQSITNTPNSSSILTPNKSKNPVFNTPILEETSRRLNYNLSSPNNQFNQLNNDVNDKNSDVPSTNSDISSALHPALNNDILSSTVAGESLGMGITPIINSNDLNVNVNPSIFGNYMPNQFGFLNSAPTPPLNGLQTNLINSSPSNLNLIPNQMNLNVHPQIHPSSFMSSPPPSNYQSNLLSQNYTYDNSTKSFQDLNKNMIINDASNISNDCDVTNNIKSNNSNSQNHNNNNDNNNNNNSNNNNNNVNGVNHRNNLSLNSTANVHRKHTSNNRRGEDASRFVNATLNDFVNEIYYLCKDQHGCRFLQRQLELNGSVASTKIFNEIQLNVIELMIDPFGNYLIQKLLERIDDNQRTTLVRNASTQFVRIALDPHGTRALQKLVECISTETEYQIIINSLSSYVVLLSRDLNGNHVIQKCLQKLPPNYCNFIFDAACQNCVKIAKHRHGCCVLQRCFDHGTPAQCEKLALKVGENCVELSIDPYGNYVVQYVLSMEENRLRIQNDPQSVNKIPDTSKSIDFIITSLALNLTKLSTHKFGSNVIEKSLRIPTLSPVLIQELMKNPEGLKLLLHDAYGNYVLQTSLDVADDSSFKELSELLKPFLNDVRNTPHGRRILSKLISRGGNAAIFNGTGSNTNGNLLTSESFENGNYDNQRQSQNHHQHQHHNNGRRHSHNNHGPNNSHQNQNNNNNNNNNIYNSGYHMGNRTGYNVSANNNNNANNSKAINQMTRFGY